MLIASVLLLYLWLNRKGWHELSASLWLLFLLTGPMIRQSSDRLCSLITMPFLILAMMGVDRYFEKGVQGLLAVSIFLMIVTQLLLQYRRNAGVGNLWIHCYGRKLEGKMSVPQ